MSGLVHTGYIVRPSVRADVQIAFIFYLNVGFKVVRRTALFMALLGRASWFSKK